jgi:HK97 family phage prohead protease
MTVQKQFTSPLEVKSLDEGGSFEGYASVFGVQDSDGDVIVKGAFKGSIDRYLSKGKMPKMLWQHDPRHIVGKFTEIREDDNGLWVKGSLILDVQQGREAYALMKAGELDAMSVGFNIVNAGGDGAMRGRVIDEVDLWEISLVTWGANPEALIVNVKSKKDYERILRDAGLSRKQALAFISEGYNAAFDLSDSDQPGGEVDASTVDAIKKLKAAMEEASNG